MDKPIKSALFLLSLVVSPAWAQWAEVDQVTVSPAQPNDRSVITLKVEGEKGTACHNVTHDFSVEGNTIIVDATVSVDPERICPAVVVPMVFTEVIGALAAGDYEVEVRINDEPAADAEFSVSAFAPGLTLSPPAGTYLDTQDFDLALILEHDATVVSGQARLDDGNGEWVDVTAELVACLEPGELESGGSSYRCPALSSYVGEGTHTLVVDLQLSDDSVVSDAVSWTVLATSESDE